MKVTLLFILISFGSLGQKYLNDTTLFSGTSCIYTSVIEVDSGYFAMASITRLENNNTSQLALVFVDTNGTQNLILDDFDLLNQQRIFGGYNRLFLNERGNFTYFYNNCDTQDCFPRLKEITPQGETINDVSFLSTIQSYNYSLLDGNNIIQKKDSTYVLAINVFSNTVNGLLYLHLDKDYNLLDSIPVFSSNVNLQYGSAKMTELDDGSIVFMINETIQTVNPSEEGRVVFITFDSNNQFVNLKRFVDGQKIISPFDLTKTEDNGYLFTYAKGEWDGNSWLYKDQLCKVDENFDFDWKMEIDTFKNIATTDRMEQGIAATLDGNYVAGGGSFDLTVNIPFDQPTAQLTKFTTDGELLWQRQMYKVEDTAVVFGGPGIEIKDVIATKDSGYCMVGKVRDTPALIAGFSGVYGYIVKTNCLGFLSDAEASYDYKRENDFIVEFFNTSRQARSYQWIFGDGTNLWSEESVDTVSHVYDDFGPSAGSGTNPYEVMLIAYGCNGDADTSRFTIQPSLHADPTIITDGNGYFTLFPNPVLSGGSLYVYLNDLDPTNGEVKLLFYTEGGRLAKEVQLNYSEGSYQIENSLARGVYEVVLVQGGEALQSERLIIL